MEGYSLLAHYIHSAFKILDIETSGLGYLDVMLGSTPTLYYVLIFSSFATAFFTWFLSNKSSEDKSSESPRSTSKSDELNNEDGTDGKENIRDKNVFEISPTDECEFVPLISHEEDRRIAAEMAPKTRYIPLDPDNPSAQVNAYLDSLRGDYKEEVVEDCLHENTFVKDDIGKYINIKDLQALPDPRESPSRQGSIMSRVKKARQRAIQNSIEKDMTADDHLKERMAANQMLSRIYTVMRENQEMFGETSFDEIRTQMELYKP